MADVLLADDCSLPLEGRRALLHLGGRVLSDADTES